MPASTLRRVAVAVASLVGWCGHRVVSGLGASARSVFFALAMMVAADPGRALDLDRRLAQLHHTAWTVATGAPPDIWAIQQSPDGFLWLGTGAGLYRFDGAHFERVQPTSGDDFLSNDIVSLLSMPSGDLWLGYQNGGVSRLSGGRLTNFTAGLPPGSIIQLNLDHDGNVWAVAVESYSGSSISRFSRGRWQRLGQDWGVPGVRVRGLTVDSHGTVWIAAPGQLLRLTRGGRRFEPAGVAVVAQAKLFRGPDDRLWTSDNLYGTRVLPSDGALPPPPPPAVAAASEAGRILFDRSGALWATSAVGGVFRVAPAAVAAARGPLRNLSDRFGLESGLSSDIAQPLLQDREGSIWVGTNLGLDRFRAVAVVAQADVPATSRDGYRAAFDRDSADGELFVADSDSLRRIGPDGVARVVASGLSRPRAICRGSGSSLWLATEKELRRIASGRAFEKIALPPPIARSTILSCQEDTTGRLWLAVLGEGIFRLNPNGWSRVSIAGQPAQVAPYLIVEDRQARMWLYYLGRPLVMLDGARVRRFGRQDGLDVGGIGIIYPRQSGIFVGGDHGIARFDGRQFQSLSALPTNPLRRITGIVETKRGDTWLNGISGVVRVATRDLDAAFDRPGRTPSWHVFDFQDGVPGLAQQDSYSPTALAAPDGRVWFITNHGLAWIDPNELHSNPVPPPVAILSLRANGRERRIAKDMKLPEGTSSLQIDYTALSLAVPARVRFRYRLSGVDNNWVDPGERRQAFYTKLGPGRYVFSVIACNNDGVWNTTGAKLDFEISPTFVQTRTFLVLALIAGAAAVWLLYSIRLRQVSTGIRAALEARLGERDRIARELHDTLLQGFQGLMLRFQAATERIPSDQPARGMMEGALDQADQVLVESRNSVRGLRDAEAPSDLSQSFLAAAARARSDPSVQFEVVTEGQPRPLHAAVAGEITRIGREAIVNAFRHAGAQRIDVNISYRRNMFSLSIVDNGAGIDAAILKNGREGHFGLKGMRERADLIRAEFTLSSRLGVGTEVALQVPGRFAYSKLRSAGRISSHAGAS